MESPVHLIFFFFSQYLLHLPPPTLIFCLSLYALVRLSSAMLKISTQHAQP